MKIRQGGLTGKGVDPGVLRTFEKRLSWFNEDFPGVLDGVTIKSGFLEQGTLAAFDFTPGNPALILSRKAMRSPAAFERVAERAYKQKWWAGKDVSHVFEHELGHALDKLSYSKAKQFAKDYLRQHPPTEKTLSGYAMVDLEEAWAEAFARIRTVPFEELTTYEKGFHQVLVKGYQEAKKEVPGWLSADEVVFVKAPSKPAPKPKSKKTR